ncbi:hypothetical protein L249_8075 [Ophiocordyceps polyrhachis-furcata BCC 54312]|uniref:Rab-GAP TBC domain-containing protein n=1 Tax=Ophiocordyceps polyrhachis-furcata BCC 54312 TaxID=1330021 RepID=A0A367LI57_9HYPO|nr:hypothetical protein L249_8075 [Ophiocordyceps polyrhachis-furcata BCC 54312]
MASDTDADAGKDASSLFPDADPDAIRIEQKTKDILEACRWRDVAALASLAESWRGLLDDELRRIAWPVLLGVSSSDCRGDACGGDWSDLPCHRDEHQVQLDVDRSFIYYPHDQSEAELAQRKSELSAVIVQVLRRHPYLCYFQGFHDICQVFILVLGRPNQRPAEAVARLSVLRIRDFMLPTLGPTTTQLRLLPDILAKADPEMRRHVAFIEPFYALAGTLTMYAHNIEDYHDIARLFDVFLGREPVFSIYLFAQILMDRRHEILEIDEADMLQVILAKVPAKMNLDDLISKTVSLFDRHPPRTLSSWSAISSASVLKTARDVGALADQTLDQGRVYFEQQVKEMWWSDLADGAKMTLRRYRRPTVALAVAVGVAAVAVLWRRKQACLQGIVSLFQT